MLVVWSPFGGLFTMPSAFVLLEDRLLPWVLNTTPVSESKAFGFGPW